MAIFRNPVVITERREYLLIVLVMIESSFFLSTMLSQHDLTTLDCYRLSNLVKMMILLQSSTSIRDDSELIKASIFSSLKYEWQNLALIRYYFRGRRWW